MDTFELSKIVLFCATPTSEPCSIRGPEQSSRQPLLLCSLWTLTSHSSNLLLIGVKFRCLLKLKEDFLSQPMDSEPHLKYADCQGWMQWSKISYMNLPPLKNKRKWTIFFKSYHGILPARNRKTKKLWRYICMWALLSRGEPNLTIFTQAKLPFELLGALPK